MTIVTVYQAKEASQGEEVIIARGSKAVARIVPIGEVKRKRQPGSRKGKVRIGPEFPASEKLPAC
jgi:antitoxin (DNA-binding transcriptional repressor) of toxin-antitoxin stability system